MIEIETFGHLDLALKAAIMQNSVPFGRVLFLLVLVDFLQLLPVNQKQELFRSFSGWL